MRRGGVVTVAVALASAFGAAGPARAATAGSSPVPISRASAATVVRRVSRRATAAFGASGSAASAASLPNGWHPAAATTPSSATLSDPPSDNDPGYDPRGDLRSTSITTDHSKFTVTAKVAEFDNPATSVNWQTYPSEVVYGIDVNNDGYPDYASAILNDSIEVIAGVTDFPPTTLLCDATPSWSASQHSYTVVFPRSCIGSPSKARLKTLADYETATDYSLDVTAWSGAVAAPAATTASSGKHGYWMLGADGKVYAFGGAVGFPGTVPFATAMAPRSDGKGYWVVDAGGRVYAYGTAAYHGGNPGLGAGEHVSTISATPNGGGYWLFTNKGRAFPYGNARSFGDMSGTHLNGPIVASVATPTGNGYYMVGSDGGIFCFGDARFHGSTGNIRLNKPVVGIAPTPNNQGYWLVASDGGVFAFNAPFRGSMGGTRLNQSVDGLVAYGNGYLMAAADGGVFDFSNTAFLGSLANDPPSAPIIGLAAFTA